MNIQKFFPLIIVLYLFLSCSHRSSNTKTDFDSQDASNKGDTSIYNKISHVNFYIEYSGSMQAYINGGDNYTNAIYELAHYYKFDSIQKEFYLTNGSVSDGLNTFHVEPIGNNSSNLKKYITNFDHNVGDIGTSDLNEMFKFALNTTNKDDISILISDGVYDIREEDVLKDLNTKSKETKEIFRNKIRNDNIQCILLKFKTQVNGNYYHVGSNEGTMINQSRPFYIWIFGNRDLLNKYFINDEFKSLAGFEEISRFQKYDNTLVPPYQVSTKDRIGNFKHSRNDKNILTDALPDRNSKQFQFSIAVNLNNLYQPDEYLLDTSNYSCTSKYKILKIEPASGFEKGYEFTPTHFITVTTEDVPYGEVHISLKNVKPKWISETGTNDDSSIIGNENSTFGFEELTDAISGAYDEVRKEESEIMGHDEIVSFKIVVKKEGESSSYLIWILVIIVIVVVGVILFKNYNKR